MTNDVTNEKIATNAKSIRFQNRLKTVIREESMSEGKLI